MDFCVEPCQLVLLNPLIIEINKGEEPLPCYDLKSKEAHQRVAMAAWEEQNKRLSS